MLRDDRRGSGPPTAVRPMDDGEFAAARKQWSRDRARAVGWGGRAIPSGYECEFVARLPGEIVAACQRMDIPPPEVEVAWRCDMRVAAGVDALARRELSDLGIRTTGRWMPTFDFIYWLDWAELRERVLLVGLVASVRGFPDDYAITPHRLHHMQSLLQALGAAGHRHIAAVLVGDRLTGMAGGPRQGAQTIDEMGAHWLRRSSYWLDISWEEEAQAVFDHLVAGWWTAGRWGRDAGIRIGPFPGRRKVTSAELERAASLMRAGQMSVAKIARLSGVSLPTIRKYLTPDGQPRREFPD